MDILNLLDSFENQISDREREVSQKAERTSLYGDWVNFDLNYLLDERKKWKEQLIQRGIEKDEKIFKLKGRSIHYSGNFVNRAWLNNYVEDFVEMQTKCFEQNYLSEISMFPGCLSYVGKIIKNFVYEEIRFIKIILTEFDISYDDGIDQEYLKYIELDEIDTYLDNLGSMISQKITDTAQERFDRRQSANQPEVWVGGEGIGGLIKGYVLGSAINFGVDKISDGVNKLGDSFAAGKLRKKLDEVFEEVRKQVSDLISMCANSVLPFLLAVFRVSDMEYWFDLDENNVWKKILEYTNYEHEHNLIDGSTYWDRLIYLLSEYPFEEELYILILNSDLDCVKELYIIATFFGFGDRVLGEAGLCIAKLIGEYRKKNISEMSQQKVYTLLDKCQRKIYNMDACVVTDNKYTKNYLDSFNKYETLLYKQLNAYKICFIKKTESTNLSEHDYSKKEIEELWEIVGQGNDEYQIDAESEYKLFMYYSDLVADSIEKKQIVLFEHNLQSLIVHLKDKDVYKSDFARCLYAYLMKKLYTKIGSEKKYNLWRDVELASNNGVILAKYLVAQYTSDAEKKEKFFLDIIENNFPAIDNLIDFYHKKDEEDKYSGYAILEESWKKVKEYMTIR